MNILMMTNTYKPHVGGVARSVEWFSEAFRRRGHHVLVVAPTFDEDLPGEQDVVRLPAIQHFNGSDFSVRIPVPGLLVNALDQFQPDIVHSHHPFLLGDTALRVAARRDLPIVFTNHTMYEQYTHYVPGDSPAMKRFAIRLATEYANLCDHVIAPSESIAAVLRQRGVETPIASIPTGVDPQRFADGRGADARKRYDIPPEAFVAGHVGRLAPEKNLPFLARCVARFLNKHEQAHFLLVGTGSSRDDVHRTMREQGVEARLHHPPRSLGGQELADAYHAMDVFAFASQSETQGMVLAEAMTAGVPIVAVDANGVREVVEDGRNGRLLPSEDQQTFVEALEWVLALDAPQRQELILAVRETAREFSMDHCAARTLKVYADLIAADRAQGPRDESLWAWTLRLLGEEWKIWASLGQAVGDALLGPPENETSR